MVTVKRKLLDVRWWAYNLTRKAPYRNLNVVATEVRSPYDQDATVQGGILAHRAAHNATGGNA